MTVSSQAPSQLTPHDSQLRRIQVLAPEVVERIAAGEVVERPVSVVRELIDNALDAGAGEIHVDIRGGGLRSIRVADDGAGIAPDQVELALRHHATSKIRDTGDLRYVGTLGFRGEALPSIAAVSDLSILTATNGSPMGVHLDLRHGEAARRGYLSRPPGTTVTVRNLFGNTPARLAFVSGARAESSLVSRLVRRYALANPSVRFHLTLDGHDSLRTSGLGIEQTAGEVFGDDVGRAFLPIGPLRVGEAEWTGFLTGRQVTRSSRRHITFLVNGRCVESRALAAALEDGYRSLLPRGRHPIAVLALTLPRDGVDVNVHPSKASVKVAGEAEIAAALKEEVRSVLGRHLDEPPGESSFALGPIQFELPRMVAERGPEWDTLTGARLRGMQVAGQLQGALIALEDDRGVYLVDQHRAHERAIYELLCRRHDEGRAGQFLLEPLHIELSSHQLTRLESRLSELAAIGFTCEWFGGRSFLVRSVPVLPEGGLPSMIDDLIELATGDDDDWQHRILTAVACRTATRRGRTLTIPQMRELIELLAGTASPAACPHGSPIILHFTDRFLERQFNW